MTNNTLYRRIILGGLFLSFIVLVVMSEFKKTCIEQQNQALLWIFWFSIILALLIFVFQAVTSFLKKFQILSSALNTALIIYFGILLVALSQYRDLIKQIAWDPSMLSLGIAVVAFGWMFTTQKMQPDTTDENQKNIELTLNKINENISKLKKRRYVSRR